MQLQYSPSCSPQSTSLPSTSAHPVVFVPSQFPQLSSIALPPATPAQSSGSGATVTYGASEKGFKILYADGVTTNTGIFDTGFSTTDGDVTLTGTQTLTNKTLTSPKIGTSILDTGGNELFILTATGSAVNEITYANAANNNDPTFTATGGSTNIGINFVPKGTGAIQANGKALATTGKAIAMAMIFG